VLVENKAKKWTAVFLVGGAGNFLMLDFFNLLSVVFYKQSHIKPTAINSQLKSNLF